MRLLQYGLDVAYTMQLVYNDDSISFRNILI